MKNQQQVSAKQRHRKYRVMAVGGLVASIAIAVVATYGFTGGSSGTAMGGMSMGGMSMSAPGGSDAAVATIAVRIKDFDFSPATITIKAGSTVVWTNDDSVQHDVTFHGGGISSSVLNRDDTFSHTFSSAGTYRYICSIHPFMHGTV